MLTCVECNRRVVSIHQNCPFCGGELIERLSSAEQAKAAKAFENARNQRLYVESTPAQSILRALIVLVGIVFILAFFAQLSLGGFTEAGGSVFALFSFIGIVVFLPPLLAAWLMTKCESALQLMLLFAIEIAALSAIALCLTF